jgi:uncharacterized protein HemX
MHTSRRPPALRHKRDRLVKSSAFPRDTSARDESSKDTILPLTESDEPSADESKIRKSRGVALSRICLALVVLIVLAVLLMQWKKRNQHGESEEIVAWKQLVDAQTTKIGGRNALAVAAEPSP